MRAIQITNRHTYISPRGWSDIVNLRIFNSIYNWVWRPFILLIVRKTKKSLSKANTPRVCNQSAKSHMTVLGDRQKKTTCFICWNDSCRFKREICFSVRFYSRTKREEFHFCLGLRVLPLLLTEGNGLSWKVEIAVARRSAKRWALN